MGCYRCRTRSHGAARCTGVVKTTACESLPSSAAHHVSSSRHAPPPPPPPSPPLPHLWALCTHPTTVVVVLAVCSIRSCAFVGNAGHITKKEYGEYIDRCVLLSPICRLLRIRAESFVGYGRWARQRRAVSRTESDSDGPRQTWTSLHIKERAHVATCPVRFRSSTCSHGVPCLSRTLIYTKRRHRPTSTQSSDRTSNRPFSTQEGRRKLSAHVVCFSFLLLLLP